MSVCVGIDVHRKQSQVAVVAGDGKVRLNRNVVNGSVPMLRLIGGRPAHGPSAAVQGDRLRAAEQRQGHAAILAQLLRADLLPEAWIARGRSASPGHCCGTGPAWCGWLADLDMPPVSREIITDCLAFIDALAPQIGRLDGEVRAQANQHQRAEGVAIARFLGHRAQRLAQRGPDRLACGRRWVTSSSLASSTGATVASRRGPLKLSCYEGRLRARGLQ